MKWVYILCSRIPNKRRIYVFLNRLQASLIQTVNARYNTTKKIEANRLGKKGNLHLLSAQLLLMASALKSKDDNVTAEIRILRTEHIWCTCLCLVFPHAVATSKPSSLSGLADIWKCRQLFCWSPLKPAITKSQKNESPAKPRCYISPVVLNMSP